MSKKKIARPSFEVEFEVIEPIVRACVSSFLCLREQCVK